MKRKLFYFEISKGFALLALILAGLHWLFRYSPLLLDENIHFHQITSFLNHDGSEQVATMLPTYHWILAFFASVAGDQSEPTLRLLSLGFSLFFLLAVLWTVYAVDPERPLLKTMQMATLPVIFPFLPLIYTDIAALIFPALAFGYLFRRKIFMVSLMSFIGLAFRQTNIIWLLMFYCITYVQYFPGKPSVASLYQHSLSAPFFIFGIALFAAFILLNGGIAMGGWKDSHVIDGVYFSNIFFFLITFSIVYCPKIIARLPRITHHLLRHRVLQIAVFVFLLSYGFLFEISHEWNLSRAEPPLLRNLILQFLFDHPLAFSLASLPATLALLFLWTEPTQHPYGKLLYLFSLLLFLPIALVEPRYHMMTFAGFVLLSPFAGTRVETMQLLWQTMLSAGIVWGHYKIAFFL